MSSFGTLISKSGFGGIFVAAPTSVNSTAIIDGTIATVDIADGVITQEKFHPTLQTDLLNFTRRLINLEEPGWYGNFRIKNSNSSNPFTFTFQIYSDTYNIVTETTDTYEYTIAPITLNHNQHYDFVLPIGGRLTNKDTIIRLEYSSGGGVVTDTNEVGISVDVRKDDGQILIEVGRDYIHNGNIELEVEITN